MGENQTKARHYRRCAEEILAAVKIMTDPAQRALLLEIAADYHKLAVALEPEDTDSKSED